MSIGRICTKCEKTKKDTEFYVSYSPLHNGKIPVCKACILKQLDVNNLESVKDTLRMIDRPFLQFLWVASLEESRNQKREPFGMLMKNLGMKQYRTLTWKDSEFEPREDTNETVNNDKPFNNTIKNVNAISDELIIKWGEGYSPEEYRSFERKYQLLKNNYQEKTAMHTEALLTYIRYRVKEELATAQGNVKDAKDWGALAQKAAQDAKINPSQLSKSDLSDGLDTFGQLVRTVEQAVDIIPILPQFKEKPQDKVDFTMWCYVNYIRDLKGLPLAEYSDIYNFYEERKKEYADRLKDTEEEM